MSKYALVTSSVPERLVLQFAEPANFLQKTIQIFRQDLDDHLAAQFSVRLLFRTCRRDIAALFVRECRDLLHRIIKTDDLKFDTAHCESVCDLPTLGRRLRGTRLGCVVHCLALAAGFLCSQLRLRCLRWCNRGRECFEVSFELCSGFSRRLAAVRVPGLLVCQRRVHSALFNAPLARPGSRRRRDLPERLFEQAVRWRNDHERPAGLQSSPVIIRPSCTSPSNTAATAATCAGAQAHQISKQLQLVRFFPECGVENRPAFVVRMSDRVSLSERFFQDFVHSFGFVMSFTAGDAFDEMRVQARCSSSVESSP